MCCKSVKCESPRTHKPTEGALQQEKGTTMGQVEGPQANMKHGQKQEWAWGIAGARMLRRAGLAAGKVGLQDQTRATHSRCSVNIP